MASASHPRDPLHLLAKRAAIVCVDGVLIDSLEAHARAWVAAMFVHGIPTSIDKARASIGIPADRMPSVLGDVERGSETSRRIAEDQERIYLERSVPSLRVIPGTKRLLERLRELGLRIAAVGPGSAAVIEATIAQLGIGALVDRIVGGIVPIDADAPATAVEGESDLVSRALGVLGTAPDETVMIAATPHDLEAAQRASIEAIAMRAGGWDQRSLEGAAACFDDPADLLDQLDSGFPPRP